MAASLSASSVTISAVLVDDEKLASDELAYLLKEFADVEVIATASNGLEAVKLIADLEPDLVFLDVQMPGLDGMGVIEKLRAQGVPLPYFVMATAYDQYAVEAFRLEALDYLLKPVEKDRLAMAVDRARKGILERAKAAAPSDLPSSKPSLQRSKLLVKSNHRNFIVDAQDVVYATIDDGLITVVAAESRRTIQLLRRLKRCCNRNLDPGHVPGRVHRLVLGEHPPHQAK